MSLIRNVKLRVPAASAKPGPQLGQSLGPLGINMAEFCKQFNEQSDKIYKKDVPLRVVLAAMSDRTFTFKIYSPPTTWLIKRVLGIDKGPTQPNPERPVAFITPEAIYEIAKIKHQDDTASHLPLEGIARSIIGTCRSMGVSVRDEQAENNDNDVDNKDMIVMDESK